MTLLHERMRTEITRTPARRHLSEWVLGTVGLVAAAVGVYLRYAPTDWVLANVVEGWYLGMFTGALVVLAAAFGVFARRAYLGNRSWTDRVILGTALMALAIAGAVAFAAIWIV